MNTPDTRRAEARQLCAWLHSLPARDRRTHISRITAQAHVPRRHWYNWQYAYARIPTHVKHLIERYAQRGIFTW